MFNTIKNLILFGKAFLEGNLEIIAIFCFILSLFLIKYLLILLKKITPNLYQKTSKIFDKLASILIFPFFKIIVVSLKKIIFIPNGKIKTVFNF